MFVSMRHYAVTHRDSEWRLESLEAKTEFLKRERERGEQRQRERWIGPNVSRIRDLGLVGTASVFFSFFLLT